MAGNANSGSKREKFIREALLLAANRVHDDDQQSRRKLAVAAAKVVEMAVEGDLAAFKEMADRIDGKAPQSLDVTTSHERSVAELTDAELRAYIAERRASGDGTAEAQRSQTKPDIVH